jgi:hypothetical protein
MLRLLFVCLVLTVNLSLLLPVAPVAATTYYAQSGGPDNNCVPDSRTTPRNSANKGAACLAAGDTLVLLDGTYNECLSDVIPSGLGPNQHTTVKADHQRMAVLTPPKSCENTGVAILIGCCNGTAGTQKNYITIDGLKLQIDPTFVIGGTSAQGGSDTDGPHDLHFLNLEMSGCVNTGSVSNFCVGMGQGGNGHDFIWRGNYVHDFGMVRAAGTSGTGQGCTGYAMYVSGWNNLFENNEFYRTCGYGIHAYSTGDHFYGNVIRGNYVHDIGGAALMLCGNGGTNSAAPNAIYNNIFARVSVGLGISDQAYGGQTGGITGGPSCSGVQPNNNYIYNNTLVQVNNGNPNTGGTLLGCIQLGAAGGLTSSNNFVRNNICAYTTHVGEGILNDSAGAAANAIDHNLCATTGSNCQFTGNPLFVTTIPTSDFGPPGGSGSIRPADFQLQASSPALAQGADVSAVLSTDYGGNARPAPAGTAPDLGAWEMGGQPITPLPPELYLYWKFDEASGSVAADSTANNHPGTLTSSPAPGHVGARVGPHGLSLPGPGAYVSTTFARWPAQQDVTVAFWVKADTAGTGPGIGFGTATPTLLGVCTPCSDNALYWQYGTWNDPGGTGSMYVADYTPYLGQWTHVVVGAAGNGSEGRIWLNGQRLATATPFSAPTSALTNVVFEAGRWNKPGHVVNAPGTLDDLRLYTQFLSDADVLALYRATAGRVRHTVEGH